MMRINTKKILINQKNSNDTAKIDTTVKFFSIIACIHHNKWLNITHF